MLRAIWEKWKRLAHRAADNDARWLKIVEHFEQTTRKLESRALEMAVAHDKKRRQLQDRNTIEVKRRRKAEKRIEECCDGWQTQLNRNIGMIQKFGRQQGRISELEKDKARVDLIEAQMATTVTMGEMPNGTKRFTVEILPWNTETIYGSGLSFRAALDDVMEE
jgi:hypothetical protein